MADLGHGWLAAICALPTNPVYDYLSRTRHHSHRAWGMQRLRLLTAIAVPVLVLVWLGAEAAFLRLDPRLAGAQQALEWLRLLVRATRFAGDGLYLSALALIPVAALWLAVSVYHWTVGCATVLGKRDASKNSFITDVLEATPVGAYSILTAVIADQLRTLLPLILTTAVIYSFICALMQSTSPYDPFEAVAAPVIPSILQILLQALAVALSSCLPLVLNSLALITFGRGSQAYVWGPVAGALMALAQSALILHAPLVNSALQAGLRQVEYRPFLNRLDLGLVLFCVVSVLMLAVSRSGPRFCPTALVGWPALLLSGIVVQFAIGELELSYYIDGWQHRALYQVPALVSGIGGLINPWVAPVPARLGLFVPGSSNSYGVLPLTWLVLFVLQLGLLVVFAHEAIRAVEARRRGA